MPAIPALIAVGAAVGGTLIKNATKPKAPGIGVDLDNPEITQARERLGVTDEAFKGALDKTNVSNVQPYLDQQQEFRGQQKSLADLLMARAQGQGPSLVDPMLAQARENAIAQTFALQGSARGRQNIGALQRQSGLNLASQNQSIEREGMAQKLREIFEARTQLGGVLQAGRAGDISAGGLSSQDAIARAQIRNQLFQQALERERAKAGLQQQSQQLQQNAYQQDVQRNDAQVDSIMGAASAGFGGIAGGQPGSINKLAQTPTGPDGRRTGNAL